MNSKPIGYYTSLIPNNDSFLNHLENNYGSWFEKVSIKEKLFLIHSLAIYLCSKCESKTGEHIYELAHKMQDCLDPSDIEGMIAFLIDQVKAD